MRKMLPWHNAAGWREVYITIYETVTINREHGSGLKRTIQEIMLSRVETVRRAANVAEREVIR